MVRTRHKTNNRAKLIPLTHTNTPSNTFKLPYFSSYTSSPYTSPYTSSRPPVLPSPVLPSPADATDGEAKPAVITNMTQATGEEKKKKWRSWRQEEQTERERGAGNTETTRQRDTETPRHPEWCMV